MSNIIGLCNQKGGVGKTTTAINLAASLAAAEKRILLVDFDPQSNTTSGLGITKNLNNSSTYELILGEGTLKPLKTNLPFLDLLPGSSDLVGAEVELVNVKGREFILKKKLEPYLSQYDFIFIDSPPSLGLLTLNVLAASTALIIPVQCEYYSLEGLADLSRTISLVQKSLNPQLKISGILLTMYDGRNNLAHDVENEIRQHYKEKVFQTVIPRNVRLSEAPSHGKPVLLYDAISKGAESYLQLAREFLMRFDEEDSEDTWNQEEALVEATHP